VEEEEDLEVVEEEDLEVEEEEDLAAAEAREGPPSWPRGSTPTAAAQPAWARAQARAETTGETWAATTAETHAMCPRSRAAWAAVRSARHFPGATSTRVSSPRAARPAINTRVVALAPPCLWVQPQPHPMPPPSLRRGGAGPRREGRRKTETLASTTPETETERFREAEKGKEAILRENSIGTSSSSTDRSQRSNSNRKKSPARNGETARSPSLLPCSAKTKTLRPGRRLPLSRP
jgi:hypothetical protein